MSCKISRSLAGCVLALVLAAGAQAGTVRTWDGGGGDANWMTAANWAGDIAPIPGDDLIFTGAVQTTNNNDFPGGTPFNSIRFDADGFNITGNQVALGAGGINNAVGQNTMSIQLDFAATRTVTVSASELRLNGVISGAGGLTKLGGNSLTLAAVNTYGGDTTISDGALGGDGIVANIIPDTSNLIVAAGAVYITGFPTGLPETIGSLSGAGQVNLSGRTLTIGANNASTTFSGDIIDGTGTGNLVKFGNGTLTLSGTAVSTYTGTTTLSQGKLNIQKDSALGSAAGLTLVEASTTLQLEGNITIAEQININGNGTGFGAIQSVSGTNVLSGQISPLSASTIFLSTGLLQLTGLTNLNNQDLELGNIGGSIQYTPTSVIAGTGTLKKSGIGDLIIEGNNTYIGVTGLNLSGGTTIIRHANALGSTGAGTTVDDGARLRVDGAIAVAAEPLTIKGTGVANSGALESTGNNSYAGAITLSANSSIRSATIATTFTLSGGINNAGFALTIVGLGDTTESGVISGAGGLTKSGTGTLQLSSANTYTGGTTVSQGTIRSAVDGATPGTVTLGDLGTGLNDVAWLFNGGGTPTTNIVVSNQGGGTATIGTFSGPFAESSGSVTLNRSVAMVDATGERTSFNGPISGDLGMGGVITIVGTRMIFGDGTNSFIGNLDIPAGSIYQNNSQTALPLTTSVNANGVIQLQFGGTHTINALTGSGTAQIIAGFSATLSVGNSGGSGTFSGVITDGAASLGLAKEGAGTQTLSGANSYTGTTTVSAGTLTARNSDSLGAVGAGTDVSTGATLALANFVTLKAEPLSVIGIGVGGAGALRSATSQVNELTGPITLTGAATFGSAPGGRLLLSAGATVNNGGFTLTTAGAGIIDFNDIISNTGGLTVSPTSFVRLFAANTYTGTTTVDGVLEVNGIQPSSAVSVNSGGELRGTGEVGAITLASGGKVVPAGTGISGVLTSGSASFVSGSTLSVDLNGTAAGSAYDQLNVKGAVSLGDATLSLAFGYAPAFNDSFTIINNDGADAVSGTFNGLAEGTRFLQGSISLQITYAGGDGNDVVVTCANAPPVATTAAGAVTYTENAGPVIIDAGVLVSDFNNASLASATVSIASNFSAAEDSLSFTNTATITGSYNALSGVLTLSGSDSVANYQSALRSVTYTNSSENPSTATRTIAFVANDGVAPSNTATKNISIISINDVPSFTKGANQSVLEDAGAQTVAGWATSISAGPGAESSQTLTFTVTNDNNALFSVQPAISAATGTLTYTPAANANGVANITIRLQDNGGTANGGIDSVTQNAIITVTAVNDTPTAGAQTLTTNEDTPIAITLSGTDTEGSTLTFTVVSPPARGSLSGTGANLTYTPQADLNGADSFTFRSNDGQLSSTVTTIQINVTAVNDVPVITSAPAATPNPATTKDVVVFSAAASDDNPGLVLSWAFGDGTSDTTNSGTVSHTFATAGSYTVILTATDAGGLTSSASIVVQVISASLPGDFDADGISDLADSDDDNDGVQDTVEIVQGSNPYNKDSFPGSQSDLDGDGIADGLDSDTDGDGVSNALEFSLGTSPFDPLSVANGSADSDGDSIPDWLDPDDDNDGFTDQLETQLASNPYDNQSNGIGAGLAFLPLEVKSMRIRLYFVKSTSDRIQVRGKLQLPVSLSVQGQVVVVDVGGNVRDFLLTADGTASRGKDSFKVKVRGKKAGQFVLNLREGAYAPNLRDERLTGDLTVQKEQRQVDVTIMFQGSAFKKSQPQIYSAKAGKLGSSK